MDNKLMKSIKAVFRKEGKAYISRLWSKPTVLLCYFPTRLEWGSQSSQFHCMIS